MNTIQKIYVDFNNLDSIKKAERRKARLENANYALYKQYANGDRVEMIYQLIQTNQQTI